METGKVRELFFQTAGRTVQAFAEGLLSFEGGKMIPYFGADIGNTGAAIKALKGAHAFLSYAYPARLNLCLEICQSFAVDNGAFSLWKSGKKTDWDGYYKWVDGIRNYPNFDWAVIPDVIGGSEEENDALVSKWPFQNIGVPVWHMHESIERFSRLCHTFPRVAVGGSCEYKNVGGELWWGRIGEAFDAICTDGIPCSKIHGLRMLSPRIFSEIPLASADSTTLARCVNLDVAFPIKNGPLSKETRAILLRERVEFFNSPFRWEKRAREQLKLF